MAFPAPASVPLGRLFVRLPVPFVLFIRSDSVVVPLNCLAPRAVRLSAVVRADRAPGSPPEGNPVGRTAGR